MSSEPTFEINLRETFPHLVAAPIVEAVIHWQARAGNWSSAEQLQPRLRELLPEYPECHAQQLLEFHAEKVGDGSETRIRRDNWHGFRLVSEDRHSILQFTRDGVAFSRLTPYEKWDSFAAEAWRLWRMFADIAQPSEVQRLGVRYINRIILRQLKEVRENLTSPPECLESVGLPTVGFLYQSQHAVPGKPYEVNVVRTIQPPGPDKDDELGLIVDVDVGTTRTLACQEAELQGHLTVMHWLKNKVFFSLLSPEAIRRFEKGES